MLHVRKQIGQFTWTASDESGEVYVVRQIGQDRLDFFVHLMKVGDSLEFIPTICYVGHDSGDGHCVIEEYVRGKTLRELQNTFIGQYEKIESLFLRLSLYLHRLRSYDIAHGDIKPENIMISESIYMIDFEFGQLLDESGKAPCLGYTPLYCSIEQLHGVIRPETDTRALGITMLELFQGEHPFYQDESGDPEEAARIVAESEIESTCGGLFELIADMCNVNPPDMSWY